MNGGGAGEAVSRAGITVLYAGVMRRRWARVAVLALLMLIGLLADLMTGPAGLSTRDILDGLFGVGGDQGLSGVIMWQIRLPSAVLAVLIGGCLALAGAEMQTILHNPLASPFTLGISSAAAFGAALAIVLGIAIPFVPPVFAVPVNAFVFAIGSVMLIQLLAAMGQGAMPLVLFGIVLVFGFNALVAIIQFIAPADSLQHLVFWTMGSLNRADATSVTALALVLGGAIPFSMRAAWSLTLLALGEERAQSLGVNPRRLRVGCLFRASLLSAVAVAFAGTIGFVGLVGPHIARLLVGEDHRFFLPASILAGAAVMSFSSIASKTLLPGVLLPIGIVTSLVGLPCFVALLVGGRGLR